MQKTAISNSYYMKAAPQVRTQIEFEIGADRAHCYGCSRDVLPRVIVSRFIGNQRNRLAICPHCNTVVQEPPGGDPSKRKKTTHQTSCTVFVWACQECRDEYSEETRFELSIGGDGKSCRLCPGCFGEVRLVEKQI